MNDFELIQRLQSERAEASDLELDRAKVRAMLQSARSGRGRLARTRLATALVAISLLGSGTSAVAFSVGGPFHWLFNSNSASKSQYCPPHSRHDDEKKNGNKKPKPPKCDDDDNHHGGGDDHHSGDGDHHRSRR